LKPAGSLLYLLRPSFSISTQVEYSNPIKRASYLGFSIGEISCPARYFEEASSINFVRSIKYDLGVLATSLQYRLNKWGIIKSRIFSSDSPRLGRNDVVKKKVIDLSH